MVQEPLGVGGGYWLPAGRVDPGEKLRDGGVRETLEEAGVHIAITRVLKFNLTNALRIIYLAHPVDSPDGELNKVLLKIRLYRPLHCTILVDLSGLLYNNMP